MEELYIQNFLDDTWWWVLSFMPRPLYPQAKIIRYPMDRRLGKTQSQYESYRRQKCFLLLLEIELRPCSP
jgi:hypothetical protein